VAQYQSLKEEFTELKDIVTAERKATLLYREAQLSLLEGTNQEHSREYINHVTLQLQELWQEYHSFTLFEMYYKLHVRQLELIEDYPQLLVLSTLADEFVRDLKINIKRFDYSQNYALRIYASLRTGERENGIQLAGQGLTFIEPLSENWLPYVESYFLLALHAQNYDLAFNLYKQVEQNTTYIKAAAITKEKWYVYHYFLYIMFADAADPVKFQPHFIKQKLSYSRKDKQGFNIAILILEFCSMLQANEKDMLAKKADTYKKYVERHFTTDNLIRERIFFLLMLLVIRHNFQYTLVTSKASKLANQLSQCVLPKGASVSKIEVVPYDHLWKWVTNILLRKGH
jgi:hypothetical protein